MKLTIYLAGQWNEYENNWKEKIKRLQGFDYYDPEFNSNQFSSKKFFLEDLAAIRNADVLVANPGIAPSEATWIEIGYFLAFKTKRPGEKCHKLIIIWKKDRSPQWSIEFVKKTGILVNTVEQAIAELGKIKHSL